MDNAVFSDISPDINEEFRGDVYLDDKMFFEETTINVNSTELSKYTRDDKIKLDLSTDIKLELPPSNVINDNTIMNTDVKQELVSSDLNLYNTTIDGNIKIENDVAGDVKVEFSNEQLFCNSCNEYYEEYCIKCGMLICILNGNALNDEAGKEIPTGILEIKESLFGNAGIFALKTIPKGVQFGPFTGFSTLESPRRLKRGKFVVHSDKSKFLNWMQYVNISRSVSDQNLYAFQYEDDLYYSSNREIQEGEELLVYFGEEYDENLNSTMEIDFIPRIETDAQNIFACTYCCLGFSLKVYLVEHKTVCPKGSNTNFEELVQCPFCKIYLEREEYIECCHEIYCCKRNARQCVLPALDDHALEDNSRSPATNKRKIYRVTERKHVGESKNHTNKHYEVKMHAENIHLAMKPRYCVNTENVADETTNSDRKPIYYECLNCHFKTEKKSCLKLHVKTKHKEYDYSCMECEYKTNRKGRLETHVKSKHLEEYDYHCTECEYKTSDKRSLKRHVKTKHLKKYDYNCMECGYETNIKSHLEMHVKENHLKEYDFNCTECGYKTNRKGRFETHVKSKHFKEYDFHCTSCKFKTSDKRSLKRHEKTKHLKEYDYNCAECEYKTNQKSHLGMHVRAKHFKQRDYNCMECEYKTNNKHCLKSHVKTRHLKEYDYNCTECEYKTSLKSLLETHVKSKHLKEYDYNCTECEYRTNRNSSLVSHVKTNHLKEFDFNCTECEYQTNRKSHLEVHVKTKHLKEFDCNRLPKS